MAKSKTRAPEQTQQEPRYLRELVDHRLPVRIRLIDDEQVEGTIEFFDECFIRVTRNGAPNLFIYKHDIKYIMETP